jgi:iron complex transport system permease protein
MTYNRDDIFIRKIGAMRLKKLTGTSAGAILIILLAIVFILSFTIGRYHIAPADVIKIILSNFLPIDHTWKSDLDTVVNVVRLPRILAAMLVGGGLSLVGACFQGLFRNPLVSSDILGVSQAAGFGAALAIFFSASILATQVTAFIFALGAVGLAFGITKVMKGNSVLNLILAGIAIGALFTAFQSITKYVADQDKQLPAMNAFITGGFSGIKMSTLSMAAVPIIIGIVVLILIRWRFNVLSMGEEEAKSMGVNTGKLRAIIVVCCTLVTASSVCLAGTIGWIGLIIPHVGRALVGPDYKKLLPVSMLLGAVFLLIIDDIARSLLSVEIPISLLTSVLGAPFFIYLLKKRGKGWS